ncbi:hypothetical protein GQ457_11G030030 [Hibiscus cannabinus]
MDVTPTPTPTPKTPLRRLFPPNQNPKRRRLRHTRPLSLSSTLPIPWVLDSLQAGQSSRVRSFPHVEGNYALHVYIPVFIPSGSKKEMVQSLKKVPSFVPDLHVVDSDVPLNVLCKEEHHKFEKVALGRELHISLGRAVPIRVHQIDSIVTILCQKLQFQKRRYWIDFNKWEVFVNDDKSSTFLSLEVVSGGLAEDPKPHISLAWALGDISSSLKKVVEEETKSSGFSGSLQSSICTSKFIGIKFVDIELVVRSSWTSINIFPTGFPRLPLESVVCIEMPLGWAGSGRTLWITFLASVLNICSTCFSKKVDGVMLPENTDVSMMVKALTLPGAMLAMVVLCVKKQCKQTNLKLYCSGNLLVRMLTMNNNIAKPSQLEATNCVKVFPLFVAMMNFPAKCDPWRPVTLFC